MSQQNWDTRPDPADWSQSQNLHSTVLLDSCYHQCQMSRCVSMQLLLLLRWKVRPLMHYQAINSVTEARSSIRTCFKRSVTKHVLCREQTAFLPVDLDIRAPVLHMPMTLCAFSIFTHENQLLHGCLLCENSLPRITHPWDYLPSWRAAHSFLAKSRWTLLSINYKLHLLHIAILGSKG